MIADFLTSAQGKQGQIELVEKTRKVYNILGDTPDVIAKFLVRGIESNEKRNENRMAYKTKGSISLHDRRIEETQFL